MMNRLLWMCFAAFILFCVSLPCAAGDFDGSRPMVCAVIKAIECTPSAGCIEVSLESAGLPRFSVIDAKKKVLHPTKESGINRVSAIKQIESVDGKLILQGAEDGLEDVRDGLGWTIAIGEDTGELVLTASGDGVAFVVYGACTLEQ
jgi:hypothetical protein